MASFKKVDAVVGMMRQIGEEFCKANGLYGSCGGEAALRAWTLYRKHKHGECEDGWNPSLDGAYEKAFGGRVFVGVSMGYGKTMMYQTVMYQSVAEAFEQWLLDHSADL